MSDSRIIRLATVIDNKDPKCLGRVRFNELVGLSGPSSGAIDYEPWSDRDLFCALPFLPININYIPDEKQSIIILSYDVSNPTTNQTYVAGPFSSPHDLTSQTVSEQIQNTSYGANAVKQPDIKNEKGEYRNKKSEGSLTKNEDFGISGKYGSDLRFTENGLVIRGGHLLSKKGSSPAKKDLISKTPIMSTKYSNIYLKKFPKTMVLQPIVEVVEKVDNTILKFILEYDVDNINNPTVVNFYLYRVHKNPLGTNQYDTSSFTEFTDLNTSSEIMTLVNLSGGTINVPTLSYSVNSVNNVGVSIRHILYSLHEDGLSGIGDEINHDFYKDNKDFDNLHPFYFRPTKEFRDGIVNVSDKQKIINSVKLRVAGPGNGLVWSLTEISPPTKKTKKQKLITKINDSSPEQTFSATITDKLFLLSTDTN